MDRPDHPEKEIFNDALELGSAEAREAYLQAACAGDAQLRRRVDALLAASRAVGGFLPLRTTVEPASGPTAPNPEGPGTVIGRYKLLEEIGQGGFGVVYMAEQLEPVRRKVALKVIKPGMDTRQVIARFEAERQALAIMDHPNIAKVFDAGATPTGRSYFVMELVRGIAITRFCDENRLSTRDRVEMFAQVCRAIQHAHQKGIIHRDIKPSNILVTINDGVPVPRIIDFGIAKATHPPALTDKTLFTAFAQFIGTPAYMSPEQACMNSLDIDTRSDIYSLGVLLYELLTGQTPFDAKALLAAGVEEMRRTIREQEPVRPSTRLKSMSREDLINAGRLRQSEPPRLIHLLRGDLDWIVIKCLEKDRNRRYQTAHALADDVERHLRHEPILARSPNVFYVARKLARKHRIRLVIGAALTSLLVALAVLATMYWRSSNLAWARAEALPRVIEFVKRGDNRAAFDLAGKIQPWIGEDPALIELWPRICGDISLTTTPPGAKVWCREYTDTNEPWLYLGRSPLENVMLPRCTYRWRFELESFAPHECVADHGLDQHGPWHVQLSEEGTGEGMVWINAGENFVPTEDFATMRSIRVPAFQIDRYEVTNEEFQQFVDCGGYRNSHFWEELRYIDGGSELTWTQAVLRFVDQTGQPGPATWRRGTYPAGQAKHPVSGVSWFEAAAYARFAGKALPTVHHWHLAACLGEAQVIIPRSNLGARSYGPAPVGSYPGMGHSGLYDMAGNVKEWCLNATDASGSRRSTLGGSWNEPTYVFGGPDSRSPWERSIEIGFRCAQFSSIESAVQEELLKPFRLPAWRDFSDLTPFSDDEFAALREQHRYDETPLNAETAEVDDRSVFWRKETITMDPAYSGDRLIAHLFLPKDGRPPFQTVIFFPGGNAVSEKTFTGLPYGSYTESIIHSGRALLFPIYYGTYERPAALGRVWTLESVLKRPLAYRDWMIHMTKDLGRCVDYLEKRDDIDHGRYAYYGMCHGAILGPILLAVEERIKAGVFALGGLVPIELPRSFDFALYAQRVRIPVLMVNGREDALVPWETSQKPLFDRLKEGNPLSEYKPYPGGHGVLEGLFSQQIHQEVLAWLDRFLGPVAAERRRQPRQTQTTP